MIIIIFSIMNKLLPLAISFITLMSIRMELGGFHCKKNWQCFIVTFTYYLLTIMAADYFSVSIVYTIIIDVVAFISILTLTPINSKLRNIKEHRTRLLLKIRVSVVMIIIFCLEFIISEKYRNYIVCSLVFILVEILLQIIYRYRKR